MKKFIYTFSEEEYKELLTEGFVFMSKIRLNDKDAYVFLNSNKIFNFSKERQERLMFTDKLYF